MSAGPLVSYHSPNFISAAGLEVAQVADAIATGVPAATLVAGTTYYVDLGPGVEGASRVSPHFIWDATIIVTSIVYEMTNLPGVSLRAATVGWESATATTPIAIAGGAAAENVQNWADVAVYRLRAVIVVGATGGKLGLTVATKE